MIFLLFQIYNARFIACVSIFRKCLLGKQVIALRIKNYSTLEPFNHFLTQARLAERLCNIASLIGNDSP